MLRICVISSHSFLIDTCRSVLDDLIPGRYELISDAVDDGRVFLWDRESLPELPNAVVVNDSAVRLIIASKRSIAELRASRPNDEFFFIQSPWTAFSLRVALASSLARLQLQNSPRPTADRDLILQKLLETSSKLQESHDERTNFLMRAVHDFRVPLMAIHGYCKLLLDGQMGPLTHEQSHVVERMERSIKRVTGLADAMLELGTGSKISANNRRERVNLHTCVHQAIHELLPHAEQKQISLNLDLEPLLGDLFFDSGQLEQVVVNLLDNACKFTTKKGTISILGYSVEERSGTERFRGYRIDIANTGPGIPKDRLEHIFDEYMSYQGSADRAGAGLGLAVCRMLIEAHNGHIWAGSSESGATFSFKLPYGVGHFIEKEPAQLAKATIS